MKTSTKVLLAGTATAVVAGSAYLVYRYLQANESSDEGFVEERMVVNDQKRVLVLGLNDAGKSQFLMALAKQTVKEPIPTDGFNVISVQTEEDQLDIWEIGGTPKVRQYWPNFVQDTDILVFVLDASNRRRFPEAFDEMHKLLGEQRLINTPFLVLAHKQDVENAAGPSEVKEALGLEDIKYHGIKIVPTSVTDEGSVGVEEVQRLLTAISHKH